MTKYLKKYIKEIEVVLESDDKKTDWKRVLDNHRTVIGFMQHERLIHLMVTLTFGILFVISMMFSLINPFLLLMVMDFLLLVLLVPYIFHYFRLENGVQKMYWIDKVIQKKIKD